MGLSWDMARLSAFVTNDHTIQKFTQGKDVIVSLQHIQANWS
jgi:hypothetical protein